MPDAEYLGYNKLTVTICDTVVISNINTKGRPPKDCGAYLTSLSINSAPTGDGPDSSIGAQGSIKVIDYKHAVSDALVKHYNDYSVNSGNPCAPVSIELYCFTGKKTFSGYINDWKLNFSGSVAEIDMQWTVVGPSMPPKKPLEPSMFTNPGALISYIQENLSDNDVKYDFVFKDSDGNEFKNGDINNAIKFIGGYARLRPEHLNSTGELLLDIYSFICKSSVTNDGKSIVGQKHIIDDKPVFSAGSADPLETDTSKNEETDIFSKLVFTFNSNFKPYVECPKLDNKFVIPLTSFSTGLSFKNMSICNSVTKTMNGDIIYSNTKSESSVDSNKTDAENSAKAKTGSDMIEMDFECYNIGHFVCNNLHAPIITRVYDEDGILIDYLSRDNLIVRQVTYDFSGPVIKASVKCSAALGNAVNQANPSKDNAPSKEEGADTGEDSSKEKSA